MNKINLAGTATFFCLAGLLCLAFLACRPQGGDTEKGKAGLHFTQGPGWTGEPAGLVYDEGTYHLFYQCNPESDQYGHIHWGHAVSRDLLQWQIASVALSPDSLGYLQSGSVVADTQNTSGLGTGQQAPFIAFYTYANPELKHTVARAYSLDKGMTWTKLPLLALPGPKTGRLRHPHVSRNRKTGGWLMTVSTGSSVLFYTSLDCRQWHYASEFKPGFVQGAAWEGTDFFPLRAAGEEIARWVLTINMENGPAGGAPATRYFIGDFDGTAFHPTDTKELWLDYGKDHYAGSTFNGLADTCRIWLGWMNNWEYALLLPSSGGRGAMTFPRRLNLVREGKHYMLASAPVKALEAYYKDTCPISPATLSDDNRIYKKFPYPGKPCLIRLKFDNRDNLAIWKARDYGIRLKTKSGRTLSIGYRNELSAYYIDRGSWEAAPCTESFGQLMGAAYRWEAPVTDWWILFDKNSVEFFACGGRIALSALYFPQDEFSSFELFAQSGQVHLAEASITSLEKQTP